MNKAIIFVGILVIATRNTYAYIDPGTGSYILQILLAGIFGGLLTFRNLRKTLTDNVKRFFTRMPQKKKDAEKE